MGKYGHALHFYVQRPCSRDQIIFRCIETMTLSQDILQDFRQRVRREVRSNILPFWIERARDDREGGYYGLVSAEGTPDPHAPKGGILAARSLWTFARAYRAFGDQQYRDSANHAYHFFADHFWDAEYGGTYWLVDAQGKVLDARKQVYAQGFSIYGFSEYFLATGEAQALQYAIRLFELVEQFAYDPQYGGYFEGFHRNWEIAQDFRLSDKESNDPKTMNTHLHILEPYTNLLRAWDDPRLKQQQRNLIRVFLDQIIDPDTGHFRLFFNAQWGWRNRTVSYGHAIEGSWLLTEAAQALADPALSAEVESAALKMAHRVYVEARDDDGAIFYEAEPGGTRHDFKEWWAEAEAVVGFLNAYQLCGEERYLDAAWKAWQVIETYQVNRAQGEWHRTVSRQGIPLSTPLVDFWKCPYHNSRACIEVAERLESLTGARQQELLLE